jgi:NAD+ synthase
VIPERVITKPPSAELRPDQTDQDSLPPYDELDGILQGLIEQDLSARELVEAGHDPAVVRRVSNLLDIAEYKRRQAPPGVKITHKAFGRDRRYPITNAFRKIGIGGQGRNAPRPDPAAERAAGPARPSNPPERDR